MYEGLKLVVTSLVLPPGGPLVLLALGVLLWRRLPRVGRGLCAVGAGALLLASMPIVSTGLVTALGGAVTVDMAAAKSADAIVILGGGVRPLAPEYGADTLGRLSLERTRYGAYLARQTGLPVLVTGGSPEPGVRPEADLMAEALTTEYGLAVRWVDDRPRNTRESAASVARLLIGDGKRRILLVMHGFDVRRAERLFAAAGLDVIAAPTLVPRRDRRRAEDFLPSVGALYTTHFALYELLALAREGISAPAS